jgi:hypothetical protein
MGKQNQGLSFVVKLDPTRRKMSPEELEVYLREKSRGCGIHGIETNKTQRRKERQKARKEGWDE